MATMPYGANALSRDFRWSVSLARKVLMIPAIRMAGIIVVHVVATNSARESLVMNENNAATITATDNDPRLRRHSLGLMSSQGPPTEPEVPSSCNFLTALFGL